MARWGPGLVRHLALFLFFVLGDIVVDFLLRSSPRVSGAWESSYGPHRR